MGLPKMTELQHKLLMAESWTYGRAMRGLPSDPDEIRNSMGFTVIDADSYIDSMCARLVVQFPGKETAISWLQKQLKTKRKYTPPESFGDVSAQVFGAFAAMVSEKKSENPG